MIDMTGRGRARPDLSNRTIITAFVAECNELEGEKQDSKAGRTHLSVKTHINRQSHIPIIRQGDNILHFDHPVSKTHPQTSMIACFAQLMPFAIRTGYESALDESIRVTEDKIENGDVDNELRFADKNWMRSNKRNCL